jgi:hypothetical protein
MIRVAKPTPLRSLHPRLTTYGEGDPRELVFDCPICSGSRIVLWQDWDVSKGMTIDNYTLQTDVVNTNHMEGAPGKEVPVERPCGLSIHIEGGILS